MWPLFFPSNKALKKRPNLFTNLHSGSKERKKIHDISKKPLSENLKFLFVFEHVRRVNNKRKNIFLFPRFLWRKTKSYFIVFNFTERGHRLYILNYDKAWRIVDCLSLFISYYCPSKVPWLCVISLNRPKDGVYHIIKGYLFDIFIKISKQC